MQYLLMIHQIVACRDLLRCTIYRLCVDIPKEFRAARSSEAVRLFPASW